MRLIDADRLIEDMGASCIPIMLKNISEITGDESTIVDHINAAPTIDAVPVVHAKWKMTDSPYCSHCRRIAIFKYRYCPGFGARMDGRSARCRKRTK